MACDEHHLNLLIILGGVIILRNQAFSTATLTTLVVLVAGFGWIVEGVMSILGQAQSNRALAILSGALSIIAHVRVYLSAVVGQDARHL